MGGDAASAEQELAGALQRTRDAAPSRLTPLVRADLRVRFRVDDGAAPPVLTLDRHGISVSTTGSTADVELGLSPRQAEALARGRLPLAAALDSGAVTASGPVRRYLEVEPILRDLLGGPRARALFEPIPGGPETGSGDTLTLAPDALAVELRDVHTALRGHQTLAGTTLSVPEGVISVLIGPTGGGKSTLLDHIIGLTHPDHGEVVVRGHRIATLRKSQLRELRLDIGVMFADGAPFSSMTLFDNVAFSLRQHTNLNEPEIEAIVLRRLGDVGLARAAQQLPGELSPGMRRRAGLAQALAQERSLLLCDEPDFGLNAPGARRVGDLLLAHHAEVGGTVIVVTRSLELAAAIADHVAVIDSGRVVASRMLNGPAPSEDVYIRQLQAVAEAQREAVSQA